MHRVVMFLTLGLLAWAVAPGDIGAQSMAKKSSETTEINGVKSAIYDHCAALPASQFPKGTSR